MSKFQMDTLEFVIRNLKPNFCQNVILKNRSAEMNKKIKNVDTNIYRNRGR